MPIYSFIRGEEEFEKMMSMAEREKFLQDNPDVKQTIKKVSIADHPFFQKKPSDGFRERLRAIKKKFPRSTIETF